ncbi:MAG TPA: phosphoglucosamine mutase [Methanocorpusculum sp.]|nr:phosphoglucosamine mutase [Methanocorpusculum sp.]
MNHKKQYFGTNGIRGVIGRDMTPQLALNIAKSVAMLLGQGSSIGIGKDTRTSGEMLLSSVKAGLLACGGNVIDFGTIPTPCLQYLVLKQKLNGGIMITASHNPPEYNGIKIIDSDGTEMDDSKIIELEHIFTNKTSSHVDWSHIGSVSSDPNGYQSYIDAIVAQFPKNCGAGITVVVDSGNGPASITTPEILKKLGATVYIINECFDGRFPGRLPEPSIEGLKKLSSKVISTNANFGVAHDGDADRAIFVDETGNFIDGNLSLGLISSYLCSKSSGNGVIVTPISTSSLIEDIAMKYNCRIEHTMVGSIYVARKMRYLIENGYNVVIGGEGNGGIIYPDHMFCRDGGMSAATMLGLVSESSKPLSTLISELPKYTMYQQKLKIKISGSKIINHLKIHFNTDKLDLRDGIRIYRNNSWALVRLSGTEPLIRIYTESKNPIEAKCIMDEIITEISKLQ